MQYNICHWYSYTDTFKCVNKIWCVSHIYIYTVQHTCMQNHRNNIACIYVISPAIWLWRYFCVLGVQLISLCGSMLTSAMWRYICSANTKQMMYSYDVTIKVLVKCRIVSWRFNNIECIISWRSKAMLAINLKTL